MATLKNTIINDTGYLGIPSGSESQRPNSPETGYMRFNTDNSVPEIWDGSEWKGLQLSSDIVSDGLILDLDAYNNTSYIGTGTNWNDISGNNNHYTFGGNLSYNSPNSFNISNSSGAGGGANNSSTLTTSTNCTLVLWIKTTDTQALFWGSDPNGSHGGSYFVGAFRSGNKEYYGNCGSPDYYQDLTQPSNIYDNVRDGQWHMVEFKNLNFSTWTNQHNFNSYDTYTFDNGEVSRILLYDKNLTTEESSQNYSIFQSRFGL